MPRVFFRFACGARLPRNGSIESKCDWSDTRKRDGRPKFCAASVEKE